MATEAKKIMDLLSNIQSELGYIKEHITDIDLVLTDDDSDSLNEAETSLKEGKTKRLI